MIRHLELADLRWNADEDALDVESVEQRDALNGRPGALGQERALAALELGLGIRQRGFNIFVVGASGTGRTSTVRTVLENRARDEKPGADVVLLYNFDDRDRPHAVCVPPGAATTIEKRYEQLVDEMLGDLEKIFESEAYLGQRQELDAAHQAKTDELLSGVEEEARQAGFILSRAQGALTLGVADEQGNPLSEEAYEALSPEHKQELEALAEGLQGGLEEALRRVRNLEKSTDEKLENLAKEHADRVLGPLIEQAQAELEGLPRVVEHLDRLREDVLNRLQRLVPEDAVDEQEAEQGRVTSNRRRLKEEEEDLGRDEPALLRYRVNALVQHDPDEGAPVIVETHPTTSNLLGRIVHKNRGGDTTTDHTLIKGGALYNANGGYLILQAQDLLRDPTAWEGLKRALKNREIELDDPGEPGRMLALASLRPEPLPLSVKVCLIGTPDLYYALSRNDPDFTKLFKVKVDFDLDMAVNDDHIQQYLTFIVGLAHEEKLKRLAPSGAARILEYAARISHHAQKLTTRFGWIADLVREASFFTTKDGAERIERKHVRKALEARAEREGFLEIKMREDIKENRVNIETEGDVIGQVNGLTVLDLGSYQFGQGRLFAVAFGMLRDRDGMPARITSRVGVGKGEMIDIEREVELGGPIHTKGTLILRGILLDRFGRDTPLKIASTLCIEQSYSDIDGDSASLAEAPIHQHLAMTGSIDQRGRVQAVGGVNEKIEGFYRVTCERQRGTPYGVIIPKANCYDLMLDEDVLDGVKAGQFKVYAIETLEDALELLTGRKWDEGDNPLRPAILERLHAFAEVHLQGAPAAAPPPLRKASVPLAAKPADPTDR